MIPVVHSIKTVEKQYSTGEEPLLVICSDLHEYVCKYARTSGAAYKLASELIGACLAQRWGLKTPPTSFVKILPSHWMKAGLSGTLAFGSMKLDSVIDISPATVSSIEPSCCNMKELLSIALFDFWVANEDRNANNANLMYDLEKGDIIPIDYGCIFNTAMYDSPLSQLTITDTILDSGLFHHLKKAFSKPQIEDLAQSVKPCFRQIIDNKKQITDTLTEVLPVQWRVPGEVVESKLQQLFSPKWYSDVWENFMECLEDNMNKQQ